MRGEEKIYYRLIQAVFFLLGHLPKTWGVSLGNMIGEAWYKLDKRHRDVALSNMSIAFKDRKSPDELDKLALNVFRNIGRIPFEIAWSQTLTHKDFLKYFEIRGLYNIKNALKKGKGAIGLTAHTGNWEFLPPVLSLSGVPLIAVYRPLSFKPLDRYLAEYRNRFGVKLIPKKKSMRKLLKSLSKNEFVGIVFDQDSGRTAGVFADFFNKKACTSKGIALIALKTKVPVIPVFIARTGSRFRVEIGQEIRLIKTGNKEQDIEANTRQYNLAIEDFIRRYPDQWFWVHNRFKTRPRPNNA